MELEGRRIALFGAAGAIGQSIAEALRRAGRPYRVVGRTQASLTRSFGHDPLAEVVAWNPDLTAGNSVLVDIATTSGASTGFPIPPSTLLSFPNLGRHAGLLGGRVERGRLREPVLPREPLTLLVRGPLAEAA
jgi:hypothetical protein